MEIQHRLCACITTMIITCYTHLCNVVEVLEWDAHVLGKCARLPLHRALHDSVLLLDRFYNNKSNDDVMKHTTAHNLVTPSNLTQQ